MLPPVGFSVGAGSWARVEAPTELPADALWVVESMETGRPAAFALATYAREGSKLVVYILNVRDYAANGSLQVTLLRLR